MAKLTYSTYIDELEIQAGALETVANQLFDAGETVHAAFYFGAASGIDQLLRLGKPEDSPYRVLDAWGAMERRIDGADAVPEAVDNPVGA